MKINNAKTFPKVYYGLHMCEGVAEYADIEGNDPYRILIVENALKTMDPTYAGRPVYVQHVDEVDLKNIQNEADGYVMESFFNVNDGKHWAKFIIVSDAGHEAIRRGWKLSNSYTPKSFTEGGLWHGVEYLREITNGEYDHLAIVPNPRYEESVIMTPEEFKRYNEEKKSELERLSNSKENKGENKMKLNFFKRAKVDNAVDLENMSVVLPKSGKEMTIVKLVEEMDKIKNMHGYANGDHMVKVGENEMTVNELVSKHMSMHDELEAMKEKKDDAKEDETELDTDKEDVDVEGDEKSKDNDEKDSEKDNDDDDDDDDGMDNDEDEAAKKKALELAEHEDKEIEAAKKKKNEAEVALKKLMDKKSVGKKSNLSDLKRASEKKAIDKAKADRLKNAYLNVHADESATIELMSDQVERGKSRYGSN